MLSRQTGCHEEPRSPRSSGQLTIPRHNLPIAGYPPQLTKATISGHLDALSVLETDLLGPQILRSRPDSYWTASANSLEAMLRNMKGRRRREMVRDLYAAGKLEGLSNILLSDSLDDEARKRLGKIHPTFMGGEYLPDFGRHEIEIVRIN